MSPANPFRLDCFDHVLAPRMPADEWRRVLALRQRPGFLGGLARYEATIPGHFAHNIILNKVVTEEQRFEMLVYALHLHDTADPADPRSGLTLANLQRVCAAQEVASPGRVAAILGIMRLGGYLAPEPSLRDARVTRLRPTAAFVAIVERWNADIFAIIDTVAPGDDLAGRHAREPRFGWDMRRNGAEGLLGGWYLLDAYPEVAHFIRHDGGWMLLLHCIARVFERGGGGELAPVALDLAAFGRRFGVSRSHLRRVLESAHAAGLLAAPPRNGAAILPAPHLAAAFLTCMASELSFYREAALRPPPS